MIRYKGFTIYSLGLNRYKIQVGRRSVAITDTFDGGIAEILTLIDEIDNDLKGVTICQ